MWQSLQFIFSKLPNQQIYTNLHSENHSWHNTIFNMLPMENDEMDQLSWNEISDRNEKQIWAYYNDTT